MDLKSVCENLKSELYKIEKVVIFVERNINIKVSIFD